MVVVGEGGHFVLLHRDAVPGRGWNGVVTGAAG